MVFLLLTTVFAHNWIHGASRANKASTILPAPPKTSARKPHYQVGANQEFAVEWATGHPGSYYYFVVLKASDENKLGLHNEVMLNQYIDEAPSDAWLYNAPRFQRMHISCTHLYPNNPGSQRDCPQESWNDGTQFERQISPDEDIYFDREVKAGPTNTNMVHFKIQDEKLAFDKRVSYFNSNFPWIEAVHKFRVSYKWPREWDLARFTVPARQGSGEYLIHMLWRGYRDVIDIDVLPAPAVDVYGEPGTTGEWTKRDHCFYPNYYNHRNTQCHYFQADEPNNIDACQRYCESRSGTRCTALNVVPLINPEVVKIAGQTPDPEIPWNNKCRQSRVPSWADKNTMVCYTFQAQEPTYDGFNPETEDIWIIRDNDPQDPIFYSTCYRREVKRIFTGNVECLLCEQASSEKALKWQINDRCLSCADAASTITQNTVKLWQTHEVCEKCF
jgi:hypothetical protein